MKTRPRTKDFFSWLAMRWYTTPPRQGCAHGCDHRILTGTLATGLGTLPPGDPIPGETFAVSDTASYRYLELHVTSARIGPAPIRPP